MRGNFSQTGTLVLALIAVGCSEKSATQTGSDSSGSGSREQGGSANSSSPASRGGTMNSGGSAATTVPTTGGNGGTGGASTTGGAINTATGGNPSTGGSSANLRTTVGGTSNSNASGGATASATGGAAGGAPTVISVAAGAGGVAGGGSSRATGGGGGSMSTGGAKATAGAPTTACGTQPTLRKAADCTGRLIGVALSTQHLSETSYVTAAKEFNYVTPENEMKWSSNEPTRNQFSFAAGDQIVSFATSNGMKVKGHALVWHNQLPAWVSSLTSATEVRAAMLAHISGVVGHYRGKVAAWDVVNEAVTLDGTGLRDSVFKKYLGETFIDEAFKAAREADPDAKLYYNDYNCEGKSLKANTVYELVKGMKARNVPFDGVGLQMHYGKPNEAVPTADFISNMQRIADLGLDVLISEMDVHVCAGLTPTEQQTTYHNIVAACVAQSRCIAVTFWGINDQYSWLNDEDDLGCATGQKPLGLLWDDNFKKKPAYTGVLNALVGQ